MRNLLAGAPGWAGAFASVLGHDQRGPGPGQRHGDDGFTARHGLRASAFSGASPTASSSRRRAPISRESDGVAVARRPGCLSPTRGLVGPRLSAARRAGSRRARLPQETPRRSGAASGVPSEAARAAQGPCPRQQTRCSQHETGQQPQDQARGPLSAHGPVAASVNVQHVRRHGSRVGRHVTPPLGSGPRRAAPGWPPRLFLGCRARSPSTDESASHGHVRPRCSCSMCAFVNALVDREESRENASAGKCDDADCRRTVIREAVRPRRQTELEAEKNGKNPENGFHNALLTWQRPIDPPRCRRGA
jgi:hypothetical protein